MSKIITTIDARKYRYVSQIPKFKTGLPHGILAKKSTDVGGSYAAVNCATDYIIVCPYNELLISLNNDKNNSYETFIINGNSKVSDFKKYISRNSIYKILTTYDSLEKVINWIETKTIKQLYMFKVLVDEFHLVIQEMGYRESAINSLMNSLGKIGHYTFMSATPIRESFLPKMLDELPYTELDWGINKKIIPTRIRTRSPYKATVALINEFKEKKLKLRVGDNDVIVEELYIFLNSVKGISEIVSTCELDESEIKIVAADTIKNSKLIKSISKVTDPAKPINFFTKKGFQGCNLFSNNGLIVVVSDSTKKHTLIDIETTLFQICGRLRENKEYSNILKDRIWHIYSTGYNTETQEEFIKRILQLKKDSLNIINMFNRSTDEEKESFINKFDLENVFISYENNEMKYSDIKEKYEQYNYYLTQEIYKNGLSLKTEYNNEGEDINKYSEFDSIVINKIKTWSFKDLLKEYIELKNEGDNDYMINRYEQEYPLFKEAYYKLGEKKINSCKYVEKTIIEKLKEINSLDMVFNLFIKRLNVDFIPNSDAKILLKYIYKELNIIGNPTASLLDNCDKLVKSNKKENNKIINGYKLKCYTY